jgi:hypothetical protein
LQPLHQAWRWLWSRCCWQTWPSHAVPNAA